ncbi:MAG: hypothetical protein ACPG5B_03725 [Chitinophagales bacterium]
MHNSKLITFFKTFTKEEFKAFLPFVQSPYFNSNKKVIELYRHIRTAAPRFTTKRLGRKQTFEYLYPNQTFKDIKLQQLMSELVKVIEKFWKQREYDQKIFSKDLALIKNYRKRNLYMYWEKDMAKIQADLTKETNGLEAADIHLYQLYVALEQHQSIEAAEQRNREPNLQEVSDMLDCYYIVNKLKYYCKALNYQRFQTTSYDWAMIQTVLAEAERKKWLKIPAIAIYYHGVQTLLEHESAAEHFKKLKKLLQEYANYFVRHEIQNIFVLARNFCIRQMRQGKSHYMTEAFELYKIEIKEGLIIENGKFFLSTYKNVTTLALLLKNFEWLEQFLYEYRWAIVPKMFKYTLSQLKFQQQKYEEVVELLQEAEDEEVLFMLSTKILLIKAYVELSLEITDDFTYEDKLENCLTSFMVLLNRKKEMLTKHYIYYLNTVKILREILRETIYCAEKNPETLLLLAERLKTSKLITEDAWLSGLLKRLM